MKQISIQSESDWIEIYFKLAGVGKEEKEEERKVTQVFFWRRFLLVRGVLPMGLSMPLWRLLENVVPILVATGHHDWCWLLLFLFNERSPRYFV